MSLTGKTVLVIGGGIGGLAAARAMAMRGAKVSVLEQAPAIREVGAGIQISPNGFAVLRGLGLDRDLQQSSIQAQAVCLRDHRRGEVLRLDLNQLEDRNYYFVHRADLIEVLAQGARQAGVDIRLNHQVDLVVPGRSPHVDLADGTRLEADIVVGADGLHSVLRPALNMATEPFFTGQVAWRAVVPNHFGREAEAWVYMAPGRHLVTYPLRNGTDLNVVAVEERKEWQAEGWTHRADPSLMRAAFADCGPQVREVLDAVQEVHCWGLFRHPVAENWHHQHCALLGDAAHPTLPFLSQGASMALEDAWALADELDRNPDVPAALNAYQTRRKARATKVIDAATGNAWKYHLRNRMVRLAAHSFLWVADKVAPSQMMRQFDWLYGHDETALR